LLLDAEIPPLELLATHEKKKMMFLKLAYPQTFLPQIGPYKKQTQHNKKNTERHNKLLT